MVMIEAAAGDGLLASFRLKTFGLGLLFFCLLTCSGYSRASEKPGPGPVNSVRQIGERIAQCWQAPQTDPPQIIEVTVRLSFSRSGAVLGKPRVSYIQAPAQADLRTKIANSILAAIQACTPMPFSGGLGASIAGRILAIRFNSLPLNGSQRVI